MRIFRAMASIAAIRICGTDKTAPSLMLTILQHFHKSLPFLICSIYFFGYTERGSNNIIFHYVLWQIRRNSIPGSGCQIQQ